MRSTLQADARGLTASERLGGGSVLERRKGQFWNAGISRFGQVKVARHLGDRLAFLEHQADRPGLELVREAPPLSLRLCHLAD